MSKLESLYKEIGDPRTIPSMSEDQLRALQVSVEPGVRVVKRRVPWGMGQLTNALYGGTPFGEQGELVTFPAEDVPPSSTVMH